MRALVFLLILANLLFFAYAQGYLGSGPGPDAQRAQQQINGEGLQVVARGALVDTSAQVALPEGPPPAVVGQEKAADKPAEKESAKTPPPVPVKPTDKALDKGKVAGSVCRQLAGLAPEEADRLTEIAQAGGLTVTRRGESGGWWVFIAPQGDKKAADKKVSELQSLGVGDYFVVNEGPQKFAISLGVFSREEAAQQRLADLQGLGVRTAKVGSRNKDGKQSLELRGDAGALSALQGRLPQDGRVCQ